MFERRQAHIELSKDEQEVIERDMAAKEAKKTVSKAKQVTKAIRSKANKSKIVFDDEGNEEKRDEDNDSDDDFNIAEASERLKQGKITNKYLKYFFDVD